MSLKLVFVLLALAGVFGILIGYFLRWLVALGKSGSLELEIKQRMLEAKEETQRIISRAEEEAEKSAEERLKDVRRREKTVDAKEERMLRQQEALDERQEDIDVELENVRKTQEDIEALKKKHKDALGTVAGLSPEDARQALLEEIEQEHEEAILSRIQKLETTGKQRLEERAQDMLISIIHRLGNAVPAEVMSFQFKLPSDEMKGKIIGKEGRNIRAFERETGVDVLIDETPGHLTISSFDPIRRHVARIALERLVEDGRIQPTKIEGVVAQARKEINETIEQKGKDAAYEAGVTGLDSRLITLLGRLYFRTSYGQNILEHSVEMSHIAGMLAEQLGADAEVARAGALLHDIGKAVDHAVQGTHVEIGRRLLQKCGVSPEVIQAMQSHHNEYPYESLEAIIVQVADAISGGRPGARRDTVENYLKRLGDLETIAKEFPGVEKCYAIEAGREIRIFVNPGKVSDKDMHALARDISARVQRELRYPGEIKVNVIRENRVVEFAR